MITQDHRPKTFKQVLYQDLPKSVLSSIAKNPTDKPRAVLLQGPYGTGKCIDEHSLVTTSDGLREIGGLNSYNSIPFDSYIRHNINLLVSDKSVQSSHFYYSGHCRTYCATLDNGLYIKGSAVHPINVISDSGYSWVKLKDLKVGQNVSTQIYNIPFDFDIKSYFLGLVYDAKRSLPICLDSFYSVSPIIFPLYLSEFVKDFIYECNIPESLYSYEEKDDEILFSVDPKFLVSVYNFNEYIRVLDHIKFLSWGSQLSFVNGIMDSRGVYDHCKRKVSLKLYDQKAADFIQVALRHMGCITYREEYSANYYNSSEETCYDFDIDVIETSMLFRYSNIVTSCLRTGVDKVSVVYTHSKVKKISLVENHHLYDLTVPDGHSYLANGIHVHNTTLSRIFARALNCHSKSGEVCGTCPSCKSDLSLSGNYLEFDSSVIGRVDTIRSLRDTFGYKSLSGYRVVTFDEAQVCSSEAQSALLEQTENPPLNLFFVFCTTHPQDLLEALRSRCLTLELSTAPSSVIQDRVKFLSQTYNIDVPKSVSDLIVSRSSGHFRSVDMLFELFRICPEKFETLNLSTIPLFVEAIKSALVKDIESYKSHVESIVQNPMKNIRSDYDDLLVYLASNYFSKNSPIKAQLGLKTFSLIKYSLTIAGDTAFSNEKLFRAFMYTLYVLLSA